MTLAEFLRPIRHGPYRHEATAQTVMIKICTACRQRLWLRETTEAASKHRYTHMRNAVTLVWGSLRLAPMNSNFARAHVVLHCALNFTWIGFMLVCSWLLIMLKIMLCLPSPSTHLMRFIALRHPQILI